MSRPMTPDQILAALKAEGLTVKEVAGWRDRCRCHSGSHEKNVGWLGDSASRGWGDVNGQVAHITAGALGSRTILEYIRDIINGDPTVPCKASTVIDSDGTVYLNSAGRCNHAGRVGSNVRSHMMIADFSTTDDFDNRFTGHGADGNAFTYGDECVAPKSMTDDGDANDYPDDQYDALVRVHAARARFHKWSGQESVGHGEVSDQRGKGDPNLNMGRFRRDVMARVKGGVFSPPAPVTVDTTEIFANLAGYDSVKGKANRVSRAKGVIPDYLLAKKPDWFHFQECAIDMWPELDKALVGYKRVAEGGKGRESYYRLGNGIEIIEAQLTNVSHMLNKDTKEILTIAWKKNGIPAVSTNFHSENQGTVVQPLQLTDAMKAGRKMADKHGIAPASVLVGGDSNFKGAAAFINRFTWWSEVSKSALKKIDLIYRSTNGWRYSLTKDRRIDVAAHYNAATILEAEILFGALISDHWPLRVKRRLTK